MQASPGVSDLDIQPLVSVDNLFLPFYNGDTTRDNRQSEQETDDVEAELENHIRMKQKQKRQRNREQAPISR